MFTKSLLIAALVSSTGLVDAADPVPSDPVQTDPDKYHVLLENERVRVLEYSDKPGERTHRHTHPAFVLYALSPFEREITLPDGKVLERRFEVGDVMFSESQTHIGHNTGQTDTHILMLELKSDADQPGPSVAAQAKTDR